jgi:hypothetical protein
MFFYTKKEAINFLNTEAKFPIVFKLKGGAGSVNVKLLKNEWQAKKFVNRAFGSGFSNVDVWSMVKDKFRLARQKKTRHSWMLVFNSLLRLFVKNDYQKIVAKEREYIYFQDFIPDCDSDIRIIIVGEKVFGMKRYVRKGDFRASGSEQISYEGIPICVVKAGIEASQRLKVQSIALDYIVTHDGQPLIVEASYGFGLKGSSLIPGFWTFDLKWHVDANESKIQDEILLQVCKSANVDVSIS